MPISTSPLSPDPSTSPARRGRAETLALVLVALIALAGAILSPSSARPAESGSGGGARVRADEVSLFADRAPARVTKDRDRRAVELGTQFRTSSAGSVTGVRVYKIADAKGATPRRASLWSPGGKRLAQARIAPSDGAGWVSVRFAAPVRIRPGRTYTVSVHAPKGRYAVTERGLRKARTSGALSTGGERLGVYRYGDTSAFPTRTWRKANYWVDVTFSGSTQAPTATPTPTATATPTPTNAAWPNETNTGVPAGTALTPYSGPTTITTPGTVIDAKQIGGSLEIRAAGVTVSRSSISGTVTVADGGSLTITDTYIDAGDREGTGLEPQNYTATRVHVVGGNRSMYCADNCTIRDSYVHGQMTDESGVMHESGIRMEQNTTLIHNTIACDAPNVPPDAGCSAGLTGYGDFAPVRDNLIQGNLFLPSTGGACAYGGSSGGKPYSSQAREHPLHRQRLLARPQRKVRVLLPGDRLRQERSRQRVVRQRLGQRRGNPAVGRRRLAPKPPHLGTSLRACSPTMSTCSRGCWRCRADPGRAPSTCKRSCARLGRTTPCWSSTRTTSSWRRGASSPRGRTCGC